MAEPARRLDDPDDIAGNRDSSVPGRSTLKSLEGGGESTPRSKDHLREAGSEDARGSINRSEQDGASFSPSFQAHEGQLGRGYSPDSSDDKPGLKKRWQQANKKTKAGIGTGIAGSIIAIIFFILSLLPFELIHIKNIFYTQIGGVQSRTYQLGRQRYYSRMFFFDEEGKFSGYKKTSIRGMMIENRQTKKMVKVLADNGYRVDFEKVGGVQTGKIRALHRIDANGDIIPGQSIEGQKALTSAWDIRKSGAIPNILKSVYPDETARWHGSMSKKLYRRWGLTRTNWIAEYLKGKTGLTALENKELLLRGALRQHLFGGVLDPTPEGTTTVDEKEKASTDAEISERANQAGINNDKAEDLTKKAIDLKNQELKDASFDGASSADDILKAGESKGLSASAITGSLASDAAKSVPGSIVRSLNALGTLQSACTGKQALDSIVIGARVLRAAQLMKFGMSVLNIADSMQNGKAVSSQDVSIMMTYLNSKDSNGNTMFDSSAWRYWNDTPSGRSNFSFSKFDTTERNKYSVGGGFTGTLATIDSTLNQYKAGRNCKVANNPLVSFGGFAVGITAGFFTGGGFTVTNALASFGVQMVANVAVSISTQMLTPIVAGTVVNGAEKGTAVGNSLISGLEVLSNANGANAGMMPLTTKQYNVALAETQRYQASQIAQMSIKDRLFSTKNERSLTMVATMNLSTFKVANLFHNPFASIGHIFSSSSLFSKPAYAGGLNNGCTDSDITGKDLAATPFCNVEVGIPQSMIDDPQYYPDVVDQKMLDGGYIDEDGNPVDGRGYDEFLKQCTSDTTDPASAGRDYRAIDIIHDNNQNEQVNTCYSHPLFNMYRFYIYIGQTENDGLTGNNISDSSSTASAPDTNTATISGDSKQLAQQILDAAKTGAIKFNVLDSSDVFDNSTPEANIRSTVAGQPAHTTTTCRSAGRGAQASNVTTALDVNLLKFLVELSQSQSVQINALAGQCHSETSSNHYQGRAVDFGCPFDASSADSIGSKYNISDQTGETCSNSAHYHYSIGGH